MSVRLRGLDYDVTSSMRCELPEESGGISWGNGPITLHKINNYWRAGAGFLLIQHLGGGYVQYVYFDGRYADTSETQLPLLTPCGGVKRLPRLVLGNLAWARFPYFQKSGVAGERQGVTSQLQATIRWFWRRQVQVGGTKWTPRGNRTLYKPKIDPCVYFRINTYVQLSFGHLYTRTQ